MSSHPIINPRFQPIFTVRPLLPRRSDPPPSSPLLLQFADSEPEHDFVHQRAAATALDAFDQGSKANVLKRPPHWLSTAVDPAVQIAGNHAPPVEECSLASLLRRPHGLSRTVEPAVEIAGNFAPPTGKTPPVQALPVPARVHPSINDVHARIGVYPRFDLVATQHLLDGDGMLHVSPIRNGITGTERELGLPMFPVAIVELHGHYGIARRALLYARRACYTIFVVLASLSAAGILLFMVVTPEDHAWHNIAFETVRISFVSLDACLLVVHIKIDEDGRNQDLIRDLLMKLVDTLINNKRFWDSTRQTVHNPLDAQKILHLVGNGLPVLVGACHVVWMAYKVGVEFASKMAEWFRVSRRVSAMEEEQTTGAAMGGNGGREEGKQVEDEGGKVESGLPVTIRASQVCRGAFTAAIMSKKAQWFRKVRRVSAKGEDQAVAGAMEMQGYGGVDAGQQEYDEGV